MIDYLALSAAQMFYQKMGFEYIEVPWVVSEAINNITCPKDVLQYRVTKGDKKKTLVASGEQGFLYLIAKGQLPSGQYQTITPCFRNDDFDQWHTKYFMKNELITFGQKSLAWSHYLDETIRLATKLFVQLGLDENKIVKQKCPDGSFDLMYEGVELGSYGIRETTFVKWVYGTGLAEPRFSMIKKAFVK